VMSSRSFEAEALAKLGVASVPPSTGLLALERRAAARRRQGARLALQRHAAGSRLCVPLEPARRRFVSPRELAVAHHSPSSAGRVACSQLFFAPCATQAAMASNRAR
jgi:hypothetical protein